MFGNKLRGFLASNYPEIVKGCKTIEDAAIEVIQELEMAYNIFGLNDEEVFGERQRDDGH